MALELTTNVSQIFTELYQRYDILTNPDLDIFEDSLYLEGVQASSIKSRMSHDLYQYHKQEGTLELYVDPQSSKKDQVFVAGCGSTQLYKGLVYALATTYPDKDFLFVQKIPYFSGHRDSVTVFPYTNASYQGYHDPKEVIHRPGLTIVEYVTSPNNPNGAFRKPETHPDIILGDFVFASSAFGKDGTGYLQENLKWLRKVRRQNIPVFSYNSASKQFGHTGDRLGYMWFPMYHKIGRDTFPQLNTFIAITVGAPLHGSSHFLNLLPALVEKGVNLRKDANQSLKRRLKILSKALVKRYPGSEIVTAAGSPTLFAKIQDPRIQEPSKLYRYVDNKDLTTAADIILKDTDVEVSNGSAYGATDQYVRINIMAFSQDLATFANRLIGENRYQKKDMLISRIVPAPPIPICGSTKTTVEYVINPNDRRIYVDASKGDVLVVLPRFLGYEQAIRVMIKRTDDGVKHTVTVQSDFFQLTLQHHGSVSMVWTQPFYKNGTWQVTDIKRGSKNVRNKRVFEHLPRNKEIGTLFLI